MEAALETRDLRRVFGDVVAVDGIDVRVPAGSFYGFLGPNGAGKSTTMKCLTGLLRPTSGEIRILGSDPGRDGVEIKRRVGVVPEDLALFDRLTGPETLAFVGRVYGLPRDERTRRAEQLLSLVDLSSAGASLVADYSHGMKKKLALCVALLPAPRLLFLDEPFEGIDAVASNQIRRLLASFVEKGGTVFLTSHILTIVEKLCDHIGVIHRGRLIAQGPVSELREGAGNHASLEELFLDLVGAEESERPALDWL